MADDDKLMTDPDELQDLVAAALAEVDATSDYGTGRFWCRHSGRGTPRPNVG